MQQGLAERVCLRSAGLRTGPPKVPGPSEIRRAELRKRTVSPQRPQGRAAVQEGAPFSAAPPSKRPHLAGGARPGHLDGETGPVDLLKDSAYRNCICNMQECGTTWCAGGAKEGGRLLSGEHHVSRAPVVHASPQVSMKEAQQQKSGLTPYCSQGITGIDMVECSA